MTRDQYNAKIQEAQAMWGDACRIRPEHKDEKLMRALFEVYWDGQWHQLGRQDMPFDDKASYVWNETLELSLRGEFAHELMRS